MGEPIRVSLESKRGCGYRKEGGLYMMGGRVLAPCGRLPLPIEVCPTCGHGIKQKIGWAWINPIAFWGKGDCERSFVECDTCWAGGAMPERAGLIWIGERFYPTPAAFMAEAGERGISRRIHSFPKGMEVGKTVVYLVHPKVSEEVCPQEIDEKLGGCVQGKRWDGGPLAEQGQTWVRCGTCKGKGTVWTPGVFTAFLPTSIEKVVPADTSDDEAEKLRKRGIEPVIVQRVGEAEADAA